MAQSLSSLCRWSRTYINLLFHKFDFFNTQNFKWWKFSFSLCEIFFYFRVIYERSSCEKCMVMEIIAIAYFEKLKCFVISITKQYRRFVFIFQFSKSEISFIFILWRKKLLSNFMMNRLMVVSNKSIWKRQLSIDYCYWFRATTESEMKR